MPKKKAAQVPVIPDQLFRDQKVCLAGRFEHYPREEVLLHFLDVEGATVVDDVTPEIDLLIVAPGRRSAKQTKAEKLNAAGKAAIRITDDLTSLVTVANDDWEEILTDHKYWPRLNCLASCGWLFRSPINIRGMSLSRLQWVANEEQPIVVQNLFFEFCAFKKSTLRHVCLGHMSWQPIQNCSFEGGQFDNVQFGNLIECSVSNFRGKNIEFAAAMKCRFDQVSLTDVYSERILTICVALRGMLGSTSPESSASNRVFSPKWNSPTASCPPPDSQNAAFKTSSSISSILAILYSTTAS